MDEQSGRRAGHKKGAHYSAPMLAGPFPSIRGSGRPSRGGPRATGHALWAILLGFGASYGAGLLFYLASAASVAATRPESDARKAESELHSVKSELDRLTR